MPEPTAIPGATRRTERKLRFAQLLATGTSAADAARQAGYSPRGARQTAYTLQRDPVVLAALAEHKAENAKRHAITVDRIIGDLTDDRALAYKTENAGAAVKATELLAKLGGHLIERRDVRSVGGFVVKIEGMADAA